MLDLNHEPNLESKLVAQYSFLQDSAFIELNNAINVSTDQSKEVEGVNTFIGRISNQLFGTTNFKQIQINKEHNLAIKKLLELDGVSSNQILKTKQGLKKTLDIVSGIKIEIGSLDSKFELAVDQMSISISDIRSEMTIRDSIKTTINIWLTNESTVSEMAQILMLLAELTWTDLGDYKEFTLGFKAWIKSEIILAICQKFHCKPSQLIPIRVMIESLNNEDKIVKDALFLARSNFIDSPISSILFNKNEKIEIPAVMSIKSLSEKLLEGRL